MENKRIIIFGMICVVIWVIIFYLVKVNSDNIDINMAKKNVSQYILIDPYNYWKYSKGKWNRLDFVLNADSVINEISWKKYDIYVDNKYYNTLNLVFTGEKEYLFKKNKSIDIPDNKILFKNGSYFKLKSFSESSINANDESLINSVLLKNNKSYTSDLYVKKYLFDNNNYLYIVSNCNFKNEKLFYIAFVSIGNNTYLLENDIITNNNIGDYKLEWVVDVNNKYSNIIVSYRYDEALNYDMYEYRDDKYKKVVGTSYEEE